MTAVAQSPLGRLSMWSHCPRAEASSSNLDYTSSVEKRIFDT